MKTKFSLGLLAAVGLFALRASAQSTVDTVVTNGLAEPTDVAVDLDNRFYIADSFHNRILRYNPDTGETVTLAGNGTVGTADGPSHTARFSSPQGIVLATVNGTPGVIVADTGNHAIRFVNRTNGVTTTLAGLPGTAGNPTNASGITARFRYPIGVTVDASGILYIADSFNNVIRQINLADPTFGVTNLAVTGTTFRQPNDVAVGESGTLWVADTRNHAVKLLTFTGPTGATLTTVLGSNNQNISGYADSDFGPLARFTNPRGLLWVSGAGLIIADTGNHAIRLATNNPAASYGSTNYGVVTIAGAGGQSGLVNGPALSARFNGPQGIARDLLGNGFAIADAVNNAIRRIQTGPPQPTITDPQIGWVEMVRDAFGDITSVLRTDQPFVFNNEVPIAILAEPGTETFFTYGPSPASVFEDTIPSPTRLNGTTPPYYRNGMRVGEVPPSILSPQPDVTIKAVSTQDGRRSSGVTQARFQFKAANPSVNGDNAAAFTVSSITANAQIYYSLDGTDPTNGFPSLGPIPPGHTFSLNFVNDQPIAFKARAFRQGFKPSDTATKTFKPSDFLPNRITFGFESGEASSDFVASPGQNFYAPVTMTLLPNVKMYSLQFNLSVTNEPGTPPVLPGRVNFLSTLVRPHPANPNVYVTIPPALFLGSTVSNFFATEFRSETYTNVVVWVTNVLAAGSETLTVTNTYSGLTNYVVATNVSGFAYEEVRTDGIPPQAVIQTFDNVSYVRTDTVTIPTPVTLSYNAIITNTVILPVYQNPPPTNQIRNLYGFGDPYLITPFLNTNRGGNLLGVGWFERIGKTNLYDTLQQDLIKYSLPHDTLFDEDEHSIIPGGYVFKVPTDAAVGNAYRIRVDRPSATTDGIGTPGSSVFIESPTNGSLTVGKINGTKLVTIGQRKYIVGDAAPFRWFNAGDFGNTNLLNDDVMQVFQSAIYSLNYPLPGSDFEDTMDACCGTYEPAPGTDYLQPSDQIEGLDRNPLFAGSDTSINQIAFGDGILDVSDIYVTFRRSLDPSLSWVQRFWTNGTRRAQLVNQDGTLPLLPPPPPPLPAGTVTPEIKFSAGEGVAAPGQAVFIPITVQIRGSYPLRVLALGLTVQPLDGSPAITNQVEFIPNPALGTPTTTASQGVNNYGAAWLSTAIAGLTGNAQLGLLKVTLPANCPPTAAYSVQFEHASASPNGLASFRRYIGSGLITSADRSGSTYNDGIPDSWRLRYFGSVNNLLAQAQADADGDGVKNWQEYKAGTNPNDSTSLLSLKSRKSASPAPAVQWPSLLNKKYVIERTSAIFATNWTSLATNTGTGWDMEYQDPAPTGGANFYRVRVQE